MWPPPVLRFFSSVHHQTFFFASSISVSSCQIFRLLLANAEASPPPLSNDELIRLLQNRQSAALSRLRKKEKMGNLERKAAELEAENKVLKQQLYSGDQRIRELEHKLGLFVKQNEELKCVLRGSDKADEMNRILAQAYSTLALQNLQSAGVSVSVNVNPAGGNVALPMPTHNVSVPTVSVGIENIAGMGVALEHQHHQIVHNAMAHQLPLTSASLQSAKHF